MNWLLLAVLAVLVISLIRGWRRGLLRILFTLISFVLLIGLISAATPHVSNFLTEHTRIHERIEERCAQKIQERVERGLEGAVEESDIVGNGLPNKIASYIEEQGEAALEASDTYRRMGGKVADLILAGVTFFVTLILAVLIVGLISRGLNIIDHIPVLKGINRFLGFLAGGVEGLIVIHLLFLFFALTAGTALGELLLPYIDDSKFLSGIYYHNVLLALFGKTM